MIRVVLENLVKRYDEVAVVDGASLEVRPGELSYVLGPSGSGKTTLARLIAGLEPLDDGEIYFDGRLVHEIPPQVSQGRPGFPGRRPLAPFDRRRERGLPAQGPGRGAPRAAARVADALGARPGSTPWRTSGPTSSPASSASGSPWPGPWSSSPTS